MSEHVCVHIYLLILTTAHKSMETSIRSCAHVQIYTHVKVAIQMWIPSQDGEEIEIDGNAMNRRQMNQRTPSKAEAHVRKKPKTWWKNMNVMNAKLHFNCQPQHLLCLLVTFWRESPCASTELHHYNQLNICQHSWLRLMTAVSADRAAIAAEADVYNDEWEASVYYDNAYTCMLAYLCQCGCQGTDRRRYVCVRSSWITRDDGWFGNIKCALSFTYSIMVALLFRSPRFGFYSIVGVGASHVIVTVTIINGWNVADGAETVALSEMSLRWMQTSWQK